MTERHRVVVIGCGAIGAATTYWLTRRLGAGIVALEQYGLGHIYGASEDHSRVIRHAYSRPEYTALTPAAYQGWGVIEQETGLQFVYRVGGLFIAARDTAEATYIDDAATAMDSHSLPFQTLTGTEVRTRWPQWHTGEQHTAIFDVEAGMLDIRRATAAHIALARDNGATVVSNAPVTALVETTTGVTVTVADRESFTADRVVLAGGAWNPVLLDMLGVSLPITLTEEQVTYFATPKIREFTPDRFPVYGFIAEDGLLYYGFPVYGEVAIKIGIDGAGPQVTPQTRTYRADPQRIQQVRAFLERYLPGALGPELYTRTCCYDFPPDRDFIVDYLPGSDRVLIAVGAGHAGKFAAVLGRILSELAIDDTSRFPIEPFRSDRPAITGIGDFPVRVNSI